MGRMLTAPFGQVRLVEVAGDAEHDQRVLRRRLEDDAAARGDGRGHLVGGQVEREVERADAGHRTDRVAAHDPAAAPVGGGPVERQPLPVDAQRLLGRGPEGEAPRATSPRASRIGLPDSRVSSSASSSASRLMRVGHVLRARRAARSWPAAGSASNASTAAAVAALQLVGPGLPGGGHQLAGGRVANLERRAGLDELAGEVDRDRSGRSPRWSRARFYAECRGAPAANTCAYDVADDGAAGGDTAAGLDQRVRPGHLAPGGHRLREPDRDQRDAAAASPVCHRARSTPDRPRPAHERVRDHQRDRPARHGIPRRAMGSPAPDERGPGTVRGHERAHRHRRQRRLATRLARGPRASEVAR